MEKNSKIYVAGHTGLVGSAIIKKLQESGYTNLIFRSHKELDLRRQKDTEDFFYKTKPEYVFVAAAKVGGIYANNTYPAEFLYDNINIGVNVIHSAYLNKVTKLMYFGSSCLYPKYAQQPMKEEYLLTGSLEPTNEAYAIAKIAGLEMCRYYNQQYNTNFIYVMPTNLYGPNDDFDLNNSHVLSANIRKFHEAKINNKPFVEIWGTGEPRREFLYIDDLADASVFLMNNYNKNELINIGIGKDISIKELVQLIKEITGYKGELKFNHDKPNGAPQKLLNVDKLNAFGWKPKTSFLEGLKKTYAWYLENETPKNTIV